jgi:hypothetical protein
MWKIIKADFKYHKFIFIVPCSWVLAGLVANLVQGWRQYELDFQGMRTVMAVATAFIMFFKIVSTTREKRIRHNVLLPLKSWQIGLSRLLFTILIWSTFLILYWLATLTTPLYPQGIIIWDTISLSGLVLIANALVFVFIDVNYTRINKIQKTLLALLYPFLVFSGFIAFFIFGVSEQSWKITKFLLPYKADFSSFSATVIGALISLLIGIAATYLSIMVFKRRRMYLN